MSVGDHMPSRGRLREMIDSDPDLETEVRSSQHRLTANETTYLKSILRMLRADMLTARGPSLYTEALADNCDWLEMFIESADVVETGLAAIQRAEEAGYEAGLREQQENFQALMSAEWRFDGGRPLSFDRETGGRFVREAWVRWAELQPSPKPSWLVPYDELSESDKEADRQIAEALGRWTLIHDAAAHSLEEHQ